MRRSLTILSTLILLMFGSCGDSAIFLAPVEEPAEVKIETIEAGAILVPGQEVPFAIAHDPVFTGDPETADRLVVELLDADEILLGEQIYESVDQADQLPELLLPEIGEGFFVLRLSYLDGETLIETLDIPFFITMAEYTLHGLSVFPATLYPGSTGLLSLNLDVSPSADPYLEWSLDDEVVQAGYLSETDTTLEVLAPEEEGAYTVRVDLFPSAPPTEFGDVPAAVSYRTELLVSTDVTLDPASLRPERSYFTLHHFQGDLRDSGARLGLEPEAEAAGLAPAREMGDPVLAAKSDIFGYQLNGDNGILIDGLILPVREGELTPFSATFRLRPDERVDEQMAEATILKVDLSEQTLLLLSMGSNGELNLELGDGEHRVSSGLPVLHPGQTSLVTVTVLPVETMALVYMFVDGISILTAVVEWDMGATPLPEPVARNEDGWQQMPGSAVLGGEGGFAGIIDEFGIYFRDAGDRPSPDTSVFRLAMEQIHGDELVYAEGFESSDLPEDILIVGEARVDTGRLVLGTAASASFPVFGFNSEELFVLVSLESPTEAAVSFFEGEGDHVLFEHRVRENDTGEFHFLFVHSESMLTVTGPGDDKIVVDLETSDGFDGVRLKVANTAEELDEVVVQSVVAWRQHPKIPASLLEVNHQGDSDEASVPVDEVVVEDVASPVAGDESTSEE